MGPPHLQLDGATGEVFQRLEAAHGPFFRVMWPARSERPGVEELFERVDKTRPLIEHVMIESIAAIDSIIERIREHEKKPMTEGTTLFLVLERSLHLVGACMKEPTDGRCSFRFLSFWPFRVAVELTLRPQTASRRNRAPPRKR